MRATTVALLSLVLTAAAVRAAEHPLADATVQVKYADPLKRTLKVSGRWLGTLPAGTPFTGATLRVAGAFGEGGTEVITLSDPAWTALPNGAGFRYVDRTAAAGGIRTIVVKPGRNGKPGTLKIASGAGFAYDHRASHTRIGMSFEMGLDRWCAQIGAPVDDGARVKGAAELAPAGCPGELVVDVAWLSARMGHPDLQLIDTRAAFTGGHIPGAIPLRPETLATTVGGVAYEIVPPATAEATLSALGIRRDATLVVYGVNPEYDPARVTWALHYLGHPDVRYLDGGWNAWLAAGGMAASGAPAAAAPSTYVVDAVRPGDLVGAADVLTGIGPAPYASPSIQLVDARSSGEYAAAHIPSASLQPWGGLLASGFLKPRTTLEGLYTALGFDPSVTTVTYCLIGWRASVSWLALRHVGFDDVRLYDGSWTEWGAGGYPTAP